MKNQIQVFIIHGGMTFKNRADYLYYLKNRKISIDEKLRWSDAFLGRRLGKNYKIIKPRMPLADNAKYAEWKLHFERYFPYLKNNLILMGISLGGTFLAKYLSENRFPKKILSTYLICPAYENSLYGEDLAGGFNRKSNLSLLEKQAKNLYLIFSGDDDVVPVAHVEKFRKKLKDAKIIIYKSKNGHFKISRFPEIVKMIKSDVRNR